VSVEVVVYGAPDCSLCDEAKRVLRAQQAALGFELVEVDISGDAELELRHREEIPVVFVDGRKAFKYRVDPAELTRRVARAVLSQTGTSQTVPFEPLL
jgi:glutaredoxin